MNEFEEAIGAYWDCAYQEGHLRRPDGNKANAILAEIRAAVRALVAAEREACARLCDDQAGYDATFAAAAIRARSNAEVSGATRGE